MDNPSSTNSSELSGANILRMQPGCSMSTNGYVFSRAKQILDVELRPIFINSIEGELLQLFSEKFINLEAQSLISEMIDQSGTSGLKLSDIESKFGLHKLHRKTTLTRQIFSSITTILFLGGAILILYACRKNFDCSKKRRVIERPIAMSALQLPDTTASSWIPVSGPTVANLQDVDSSDNNEAPSRGRKEEQIFSQAQSNLGKKPYKKQIKTSRASN